MTKGALPVKALTAAPEAVVAEASMWTVKVGELGDTAMERYFLGPHLEPCGTPGRALSFTNRP